MSGVLKNLALPRSGGVKVGKLERNVDATEICEDA